MNIITDYIIESENLPSIIFKGNNFYVRFYQSGNGDIYFSSLNASNINNTTYFISYDIIGDKFKSTLVQLFLDLNKIYNSKFTTVYCNKSDFYATERKFSWVSDECDKNNNNSKIDISLLEDGMQLVFNKNSQDDKNYTSVCFNTDRGNCREISITMYLFLSSVCKNEKIYILERKIK